MNCLSVHRLVRMTFLSIRQLVDMNFLSIRQLVHMNFPTSSKRMNFMIRQLVRMNFSIRQLVRVNQIRPLVRMNFLIRRLVRMNFSIRQLVRINFLDPSARTHEFSDPSARTHEFSDRPSTRTHEFSIAFTVCGLTKYTPPLSINGSCPSQDLKNDFFARCVSTPCSHKQLTLRIGFVTFTTWKSYSFV